MLMHWIAFWKDFAGSDELFLCFCGVNKLTPTFRFICHVIIYKRRHSGGVHQWCSSWSNATMPSRRDGWGTTCCWTGRCLLFLASSGVPRHDGCSWQRSVWGSICCTGVGSTSKKASLPLVHRSITADNTGHGCVVWWLLNVEIWEDDGFLWIRGGEEEVRLMQHASWWVREFENFSIWVSAWFNYVVDIHCRRGRFWLPIHGDAYENALWMMHR